MSPFAQTTTAVVPSGKRHSAAWLVWVFVVVIVLTGLGAAGYFVQQYLNDPYRTLEPFPIDKYLNDYRSLSGSKFKADLKVSADLGSNTNVGRLMVFTVGSDSRPLVVLIPSKLANIYFTKGQNYQASLEVGQGGLIYADSCEKD